MTITKEKQSANFKAWYAKNKERKISYQRFRYETHRLEKIEMVARRRVRLAGNHSEPVSVQDLLSRDQGICLLCSNSIEGFTDLELDHLIPVSKGGTHEFLNTSIVHHSCNSSKRAKELTFEQFDRYVESIGSWLKGVTK